MEKDAENENQPVLGFEQISASLLNIAALSPAEFRRKLDRIICERLIQNHPDFKGARYFEESDESLARHGLKLTGFSFYEETLVTAHVLNLIAEFAYEKGLGLLHRSLARVAITLAITAAEDYANLMCSHEKGKTEQNLRQMTFREKWTLLLPQLDARFPDLRLFTDLRHDKIVHLKKQNDLPLDFITDINHENAAKAIGTVHQMICTHSSGLADPLTVKDCASFFVQLAGVIIEMVAKPRKQTTDVQTS